MKNFLKKALSQRHLAGDRDRAFLFLIGIATMKLEENKSYLLQCKEKFVPRTILPVLWEIRVLRMQGDFVKVEYFKDKVEWLCLSELKERWDVRGFLDNNGLGISLKEKRAKVTESDPGDECESIQS